MVYCSGTHGSLALITLFIGSRFVIGEIAETVECEIKTLLTFLYMNITFTQANFTKFYYRLQSVSYTHLAVILIYI